MSDPTSRLIRRDGNGANLSIGEAVSVQYAGDRGALIQQTGVLVAWNADDSIRLLLPTGDEIITGPVGQKRGLVWCGNRTWKKGMGYQSWIKKEDGTSGERSDLSGLVRATEAEPIPKRKTRTGAGRKRT